MADVVFDRTAAANYLKRTYGKAGVALYNTKFPCMGMVAKEYGQLKGERFEESIELSLGVGIGCGDQYPDASIPNVQKCFFGSRNLYSTGMISRKLMKTATGGESAFIDSQKKVWADMQTGYAWLAEWSFHGDGTGAVGTISVVANADPTFTVTISAATWNQHNHQVGHLYNIGAAGLNVFRLTATNNATRQLTLVRQAGAEVPAPADVIYMQNSRNAAPLGYEAIFGATFGVTSLYGVLTQDQWMPYVDANAAGLAFDEEMLDDAVMAIEDRTGEPIDWILTAPIQWKVLKAQSTNLKSYTVPNPNVPAKLSAKYGFNALEYASPAGEKTIPIMRSRFCRSTVCNLFNRSKIKVKHVHEPQFFDEDGTVFLRSPNKLDHYEAQFGSYQENFFYPTYHGQIQNLPTA